MPSKYKSHPLAVEQTFVMVKPDGVMRGLIGEIIKRLEQRGLKLVGLKMVEATREQVDGHYPKNPEWVNRLGQKTLKTFAEYGVDPVKELGTDDETKIGSATREALLTYVTMGPVVQMVVEGLHAVSVVRKLCGATLPIFAEPGTIRGDFSHDASTSANIEKRSIFNLIHASETPEEAAHEVKYWFKPSEVLDYDRTDHAIMFGDKR